MFVIIMVSSRLQSLRSAMEAREVHLLCSGMHTLEVRINGEHIHGSRFALKVVADNTDAASCVASGQGLRRVGAGDGACGGGRPAVTRD